MKIVSILQGNLSEQDKADLFNEWLNEQPTPQSIKELLDEADILTKLAAVIQSDNLARQVVFDILTKYGTLKYPSGR